MTVARSVARAVASPVARAVAGGIGTSEGVQNLIPWSEFGGAASSVPGPAAAPTGCALFGNTGAQTLLGSVGGGQGMRFVCTAQRQYWQGSTDEIPAGSIFVFSYYVDTLSASQSALLMPRIVSPPGDSTLLTDLSATISTTGRKFQQYQLASAAVISIRFGLGTSGNATGTLEVSRPMVHVVGSQISTASEIPDYVPYI